MKSQRAINSFIKGMDRDTSVNKYSDMTFYDALNMRIITEDPLTAGAMTNIPGNSLIMNFAQNDVIIGVCPIRNAYNDTTKDSIIFFATNISGTDSIYLLEGDPDRIDTSTPIEMDRIYQTTGAGTTAYRSGYLYRGTDLNFSEDHRIKSESRYESALIRKVYWVDGVNPIRYMNVSTVTTNLLAGVPVSSANVFEINPDVTLASPTVTLTSGGGYTAGIVQYAYQLYVKNGTKTAFSPLSDSLNLAAMYFQSNSYKTVGNALNENTGNAVLVTLTNLDQDFDRVRLVALHYKQYGLSPVVNIVGEYSYTGTSLTVTDTGIKTYGTIEITDFRLQGQVDYIADSLASKNNVMFYANLKEDIWNPDWLNPANAYNGFPTGGDIGDFFDCRALRFRNLSTSAGSGTDHAYYQIDWEDQEIDDNVVRFGNDSIIVSIPNFRTVFGIPPSRTVTNVNHISAMYLTMRYTYGGITYTVTESGFTNEDADIHIDSPTAGDLSFYFTHDTDLWVGEPTAILSFKLYVSIDEYAYTTAATTTIETIVTDSNLGNYTQGGNLLDPTDDVEWHQSGWNSFKTDHDAINEYNDLDNDTDTDYKFIYQSDGLTLGAEGPYVKVGFTTESLLIDDYANEYTANLTSKVGTAFDTPHRSSARNEVYRMYLVFYNTKMQYTNPQWICDLRMPSGNDSSSYLTLSTDGAFYVNALYLYPTVELRNLPVDTDLLGWQVFRCPRGSNDRSVLASGLISKTYNIGGAIYQPYSSATEMFIRAEDATASSERLLEFISPEVNYNKNIEYRSGDKLRIEGRFDGILNRDVECGYLKITTDKARNASDDIYKDINAAGIEETQTVDNADIVTHVYDTLTYKNSIMYTSGSNYYSQKGTTLVVKIDTDLSLTAGTIGYGFASYVRNVFNTQYGGNTFEARSYDQVIPYGDYIPKATLTCSCTGGDTFITYFVYLRGMYPTENISANRDEEVVLLPVESSINSFLRLDPIQKYTGRAELFSATHISPQEKQADGIAEWPDSYPEDLGDLYRYNSAYSSDLNGLMIQCKVFDSLSIEENPFKIIASDKKINNEYSDSWLSLKVNNTLELEGKYGNIQQVINFGNRFFAFQDKAVSLISINDRSLIQDSNKLALSLGTGDILNRYDYLTTSSGIQSHTDVIVSNKAMYYLDRSDKIIYNLTVEGDNPISEVLGLRSLLKSYGTITKVRTGFDPQYKEILFYITDGSISNTIVLNEYVNAFVSRYSCLPEIMYDVNDHFYSSPLAVNATDGKVYRHNVGNYGQFYGNTDSEIYDSFVDMIINPNGTIVDKFDTVDLRMDLIDEDGANVSNTAMTTITASDSYQTITKTITFSDSIVLATALAETAKHLIRKWRVWLLPDNAASDFYRLTDTYLRLKIIRDNSLVSITKTTPPGAVNHSCKFTLHDVTTYYRPTKN
jgi:hypothetical protein